MGVAFTAAELVLANQRNRMVLDYSVQLYSQSAVSQSAGSNPVSYTHLDVYKRQA